MKYAEKALETAVSKYFADAISADVHVIKLEHPGKIKREVSRLMSGETLSWKNATPDYSYSCFDYYSNYRSTVAYNWLIDSEQPAKGVRIRYAASDVGKRVNLQVADKMFEVILEDGVPVSLDGAVKVVSREFGRMRGGTFDRNMSTKGISWSECDDNVLSSYARAFSNYLMKTVLHAFQPCRVHLGVTAGNGVELLVFDKARGEYVPMMKHLNPYRTTALHEGILLDLDEGDNEIILRSYNRFEREVIMSIALDEQQVEYVMDVLFEEPVSGGKELNVRISSADNQFEHTDCRLHNLTIDLIY